MVEMSKIEEVAAVEAKRFWTVVVSHPSAERLAKQHLENQNFEVYLPLAVSAKPKSPKAPEGGLFIRPFFPRYMFVRLNPEIDRWRAIFSTRGVSSMFVEGDKPLRVRDSQVDDIRAREENGFIKMMDPTDVTCRWQRGDPVKLRTQAGDLDAIFSEPVDKSRAVILFNLLGREASQVVTLLSLK